jgi:hypothetical protein
VSFTTHRIEETAADEQCDRDLRRRIRKVPGVPLMYVVKHKYSIERLPESVRGLQCRVSADNEVEEQLSRFETNR